MKKHGLPFWTLAAIVLACCFGPTITNTWAKDCPTWKTLQEQISFLE